MSVIMTSAAVAGALCLPIADTRAGAAGVSSATESLAELSLEELTNVEVYSASRHLQRTQDVPSAIFVITNEDLRRSGVTSVPDALRLVPGVQVGQVDANKWAVSMRGFNSREANKLLVLVDGRPIYDPLFSGMLWESQDFLLEDIERIEVIRGPGGTLWGANAFNGVINIITRHTRDSRGALASLTFGDEERYIAGARYGWRLREHQDARIYLKARERDAGFDDVNAPADELRDVRGGFRWDWSNGATDEVRVSGDVFEATAGVRETPALTQDVIHRGRNVLASWVRRMAPENSVQLEFYYDHVDYDSLAFDQERRTYDVEVQQNVRIAARHFLVWGIEYRNTRDSASTGMSGFVDLLPARRDDDLLSAFAQDTVTLLADRLDLIVGLKFENTDYADSELLPNLRLAWTPRPEQTWWAAASKATRMPSRLEADLTFFGTFRIGDDFGAESVWAYEAGFRHLVSPRLWYDVAVFYNDYDDLRTTEASGALGNLMYGHTSGAEMALRWEPRPGRRLDVAYTLLDMNVGLDPRSTAPISLVAINEGLAPRHQLAARALVDLGRNLGLDATARYVDQLSGLGYSDYTQLDAALHWRPGGAFEASIVGRNLLDAHQPEQSFAFSASGMPTEVERSLHGRLIWRW